MPCTLVLSETPCLWHVCDHSLLPVATAVLHERLRPGASENTSRPIPKSCTNAYARTHLCLLKHAIDLHRIGQLQFHASCFSLKLRVFGMSVTIGSWQWHQCCYMSYKDLVPPKIPADQFPRVAQLCKTVHIESLKIQGIGMHRIGRLQFHASCFSRKLVVSGWTVTIGS